MAYNRFQILDLMKLLSCLLILLHHWTIYIYKNHVNMDYFLIHFFYECRYVTAIFFNITGFLFYDKWFTPKLKPSIKYTKEWIQVFLKVAPAYYFTIYLNLWLYRRICG